MSSPAIRTVSAQVCRQCRKEQLQESARWTSRRRFSSSPVPLASTSTWTPATNFLTRLRFEVGQANPSLASTWRNINAVHDHYPAKLSPALVRKAIPILQQHKKPGRSFPRISSGPQYRAELTEEAEALYMRYRFVASRLRETGSEPQSVAQILYWLQALKNLSYGPAAWRIWKDALEEARRTDGIVAKQISTLVLVATAKWLFLLVEHTPSPAAIAEARKEADAVLAYLEANGQVDATIISLKIRIIKHSAKKHKEFANAVKATFGLDLDMPAMPCLAQSGTIRPVDKHSHNSILSGLAKLQQFPKMISIFEKLAYPYDAGVAYPVQTADQNSFFSLSFDWFDSRRHVGQLAAAEQASADQETIEASEEAAESSDDAVDGCMQISRAKEVLEATQTPEAEQMPEAGPRPLMEITSLNTRTFELMIENALQGSSNGVARHYMLEMLEAWEQERQRLRVAYADLAAYTIPLPAPDIGASKFLPPTRLDKARVVVQDPARPPWDRIWQKDTLGPAIGPSTHAIRRIYEDLAGGWVADLHWLKPLEELVKDVKRVLDLIRDDIQFWTDIYDKQRSLAEAFMSLPPEQRALHATLPDNIEGRRATGGERDSFAGYQNLPFNTQLHLLILRKVEAELNDIHYEMHHRQSHAAAGRYIRSVMNELERRRPNPTNRVSRLVNAIRRLEAWCEADEAADDQRAEAIMGLNTLSAGRKLKQIKHMRWISEGRRQAVRRALVRARGTLSSLRQKPEDEGDVEPAAQPIVKAVHIHSLADQLRERRNTESSSQPPNEPKTISPQGDAYNEQHQDVTRPASGRRARQIRVRLGDDETPATPVDTRAALDRQGDAVADLSR